jgi:ABC-type multidrug transport system permease subunit
VMYPTDVLPHWLQQFARFLPITHALTGLRATILKDASLAAVFPELTALACFAAIGLPVGIGVFEVGLRRARTTGTLGHQ